MVCREPDIAVWLEQSEILGERYLLHTALINHGHYYFGHHRTGCCIAWSFQKALSKAFQQSLCGTRKSGSNPRFDPLGLLRIAADHRPHDLGFLGGRNCTRIVGQRIWSEIFRAGIQSIDKGQYEASHSISLNYSDMMRYVILPQAIRRILPALGNQLVYMLKMSSLVSVIGMQELTRKANELVVVEYRPLEIYTVLVLEYLVLILIVSAGVRWLERKMQSDQLA